MANLWKQKSVELPADATRVKPPSLTSYGRTTRILAFSLLSLATSPIWFFSQSPLRLRAASLATPSQSVLLDSCPQPTPIAPNEHALIWETLLREATTEEYKNTAVEWLSGAIQIA